MTTLSAQSEEKTGFFCQEASANRKKLAVKSSNVILEDHYEPVEAIILIQDGKIADVVLPKDIDPEQLATINQEWEVKDYGNSFIFPGIIDSNVHLHTDFGTEWENIEYSTELAAAGGVTTVIDNPLMCKPFASGNEYVELLQKRIVNIKKSSKVDFGIFGVLEPKTEECVVEILKAGALGLKCYMMNPFQDCISHYLPETFKDLLERLEMDHPELLLLVHAETATEREIYLSSPCRTVSLSKRLDRNHAIKSFDFGGAANKGSYVDDFSKKESDDEDDDDDCPTAKIDSPSKLKGKIKKIKEKMDVKHIVLSELASYSFENQDQSDDNDDSNSDSEPLTGKSRPEPIQFSESVSTNQEEKNENEDTQGDCEKSKRACFLNALPLRRKSRFSHLGNTVEEEEKLESLKTRMKRSQSCEDGEVGQNEDSREGSLAWIPEELDKEDLVDTQRQVDSIQIVQSKYKIEEKISPKIESFLEEQKNLNEGQLEKLSPVGGPTDSEQFLRLDTKSTCPILPHLDLSATYAEERNNLKSERQDNHFDKVFEKEEKLINSSRKSLLLMASCSFKETLNENTFARNLVQEPVDNSNINSGSKSFFDQSPENMNDSGQGFDTNNLNMSPVFSNTPSTGSSLLQRRILRKSSSCFPCTANTTPSPSTDFRKINLLQLSAASSPSSKENKINQNYRMFLANRPQSWEENAVSIVLLAIRPETNIRVMLQNLSLASSFFKIRQKKKLNPSLNEKIIGDTCPSYLFFSEKMVGMGETKYKASPPIRNRDNRQLLVETLRLGGMDTISSYQFYVPPRFKVVDDNNFRRAFGGLNSIGCSLQAAWTALYRYQQKNNKKFNEDPLYQRMLTHQMFRQIYKTMCYNPAQVLKISKQKGCIEKGRDADLVIWNPFETDTNSHLSHQHVFSDKELLGKILKTYIRGHLIYSKEDATQTSKEYSPEFIRT